MANPQLRIDITSNLDNKGTKDLRADLKSVNTEMDNLRKSGQTGSQAFELLKQRAGELTEKLKGVARENKGLDADLKTSSKGLLALGRDITIVTAGLREFGSSMRQALSEGADFGVLKDNFTEIEGSIEAATEKLNLLRNASSGNLNDKELIQYSNKMKLLGYTSDETAKLLDIVEVQSDKVKVGFEEGEKILQKYIATGRDKSLMELGINVADVSNKIKEQTGLTTKQVKELEEETQQRIRLNAILELQIGSTGNLNDKVRDNADKIKSVETALKNVTLNYQYTIANGIVKYSEALGISNSVMENSIGKIGFIGKSLADVLPILATLKIAFPAAFSALLPVLGAVALQIGGLMVLVKNFKDSIPSMINAWKFAQDVINGENIVDSFYKGVERYEKDTNQDTETKILNTYNKTKDFVQKQKDEKTKQFVDKVKQKVNEIKLQKDIDEQLKKKDNKGGKTPEVKVKEDEKNAVDELIKSLELSLKTKQLELEVNEDNRSIVNDLKIEQQILYQYAIDKLKAELDTNTVVEDRIKLTEKLIEITKKLEKTGRGQQKGNTPDRTPNERGNRPTPQYGGNNRGGRGNEIEVEEKSTSEIINDTISGFDGMIGKTATMLENFGFMDNATKNMINAFSQIVAMIKSAIDFGGGIFDIVTGIASFFIPGAGALGAVARASGGPVNKGQLYLTGERGMELFVAPSNGEIINNDKLSSILNNGKGTSIPKINVVVNTEFDKVKSYEVVYNGNTISNLRGSNNL